MLRSVVLAGAVASTAAFAPMPALAPRLRTAQPANIQMAMQPEGKVSRAGFLAGLATAAVLAGGAPAVDASINSQMAMNSDSFSVLTDNQKVYKSTGTAENPYMTQQEKMDNLERQARIEDCERVKNRATCVEEEDYRERAKSGIKKRGNPAVTVGLPVVVTSGFSFVLLKFLNK